MYPFRTGIKGIKSAFIPAFILNNSITGYNNNGFCMLSNEYKGIKVFFLNRPLCLKKNWVFYLLQSFCITNKIYYFFVKKFFLIYFNTNKRDNNFFFVNILILSKAIGLIHSDFFRV